MTKEDIIQNEVLLQEPKKRKYTKHDYFVDLEKKLGIWKSILEQFERMDEFCQKRRRVNLSGMQEEALKYILDIDSKEGRLLSSSDKVQKLYVELQELLNKEDASASFEVCYKSDIMQPESFPYSNLKKLIDFYNDFQLERKEQNQRILDIQALIKFEQKQLKKEEKRKENARMKRGVFSKKFDDTSLFGTCMHRIFSLYKRIKADQNEIKKIQLDLQNHAKKLCQFGEIYFSEKLEKAAIEEFQIVYPELEKAIVEELKLKKQLQGALTNLKKAVETEKMRLGQQMIIQKPKTKEKSPEEKIQDAFNSSLEKNKNLVLVGKYRSLGLTNSVIQKINEDEEYNQDIIEHISGLLKTPQGQDFGKSGNSRWKPVQGSDVLYELSVNPKKQGHSQSMPRLYAKKESFTQTGELTSSKDKKSIENIWVLVKKGSKRTQENDIDTAEKVYFENDGKPHKDLLNINNLKWLKVSIISNPELPVPSILKNQGRGS